MTVLVVALMSMSAATLRMHSLRRVNRERALAMNAVRSVVDRIQATSEQVAESNPYTWSSTLIGALSAGGSVGDTFVVGELNEQVQGTPVGTIEVVVDETATDSGLGLAMGMPRDLDGDGLAADPDVSATAVVLPVVVTVSWRGVNGDSELRHPVYVTGL